jgi:hypothetical protein
MTVSSSTDRATFAGNGTTTVFSLPFRFFTNGDIQASLINNATGAITPLTLGVNYSLIGAALPEQDGNAESELTMFLAPVTGFSLLVRRVIPLTQPTDIVNQGHFLPETHEDVFDRLTMQIQQGAADSTRAIRVPETESEPNRLPPAASRANLLLGFDSLGQPAAVAPVSGSASDLAMNLLNSTDPAKGAAMIGYKGRTQTAHNNDWVSVDDFGTAGDGIVDDTSAIQNAINSMPNGGRLYYPRVYKIAGTLNCISNVEHFGPGQLFQTLSNTPLFKGVGISNVTISGLSLAGVGYGDTALTTNAASYSASARAYGIWFDTCTNVSVTGCKISGFLNAGIVPAYCTGVRITDNEVVGTYQGVSDTKTPQGNGNFQAFGIWLYAAGEVAAPPGIGHAYVRDNKVHTVAHAIFVGPAHSVVEVVGNEVYNTAQHALYLNPGSDLTVHSNTLRPWLDGVKVQTTGAVVRSNPKRIHVYDNLISGSTSGSNGINIDIIDPTGSDDKTNLFNEAVKVYSNTVSNWLGTGITAKQCRASSIYGNTLSSVNGVGIIARHFSGYVGANVFRSVSKECVISQPADGQALTLTGNEVNSAGFFGTPPGGYFTALAAEDPKTWTASTAFGANVHCVNGANVYTCVVQGVTAASGGPTGTGTGIADGTAVWDFVSTLAGIDRGTFVMVNNIVTAAAGDAPTFSVFMAASTMKFRWARNILPRHVALSATALQASIGAVLLQDEHNAHGGYASAPVASAAAPIVGFGKRQFFCDALPTGGGPFVLGDVAWKSVLGAAPSVLGWVCTAAGSPGSWRPFGDMPLVVTGVFDAPSLANGASITAGFSATGAAFGDHVKVAFSASLAGLTATAYISAANAVTLVLQNSTGAAVDLASGTFTFSITRPA